MTVRTMLKMENVTWVFIALLTVIIIISFFLPWVTVESQQVGAFSKLLTGKSQAAIATISGFKIPILANGKDARLMISIIKIFNPNIKDADKKSFAVWGIPILAFIVCAVSYFFGKSKWVNIAFGLLGVGIFFIAFFKIKTTDLNKLVLNVKISSGMWLILYAYLGIGIAQFVNLFRVSKK
ncbi:hypothetical protein ACFL0P_00395 [Candidatus Omnitrophota bacterium]